MAVDGVGGGGNRFAFGLDDVSVNREQELKDGKGVKGAKENAQAQEVEKENKTDDASPADPTQTFEMTPVPPVTYDATSSTAKPDDGKAPLPGIDAASSTRPSVDPAVAMLDDVSNAYNQMEMSVEFMYNRLIQEAKSNKAELEDQIKNIDKQIELLKEQGKKLDIIMAKVTELMPKFMQLVGSDEGVKQCGQYKNDFNQQEQQFADFLAKELKAIGIDLDPAKLQSLVEGMSKGGQAGMALAMMLVFAIAEASADISIQNSRKAEQPQAGDQPSDPTAQSPPQDQTSSTPPPQTDPTATGTTDPTATGTTDPTATGTTTPPTTGETEGKPPVDAPPEAINAGFDPAKLEEKLNAIADKAEAYAKADPTEYLTWFFPLQVQSAEFTFASMDLMNAIAPGLGFGLTDAPLTKDFSSAKQNGVKVDGFSMSAAEFQCMANLRNMPFGMGPQLATQFAMTIVNKQFETQKVAIEKGIEDLKAQLKDLKKQITEIDQQIAELEKQKAAAIAEVKKQKENAVKTIGGIVEANKGKEDQVKALIVDTLVAALDAISMDLVATGLMVGLNNPGRR